MKKAIFLYVLSREARPVMYGPRLAFTFDEGVEIPSSLQEQIELLRHKLELQEVVEFIIEENCLLESEDGFNGDETFVFDRVAYNKFGLSYFFKNEDEEVVELALCTEDAHVI
jgi:DNA-directed RNA polymerase specialized sigma54-like protein